MDNPSAFPVVCENGLGHVSDGMTLRDWFAGQALAGILANPVSFGAVMQGDPETIVSACGTFADAMLAERSKDTPSHG